MARDDETTLLRSLAQALPVPQPRTRLVWSAAVDVASRESLGHAPLGERWIVPITGGRFWGGPGFETLLRQGARRRRRPSAAAARRGQGTARGV